jgi:predicted transcriptional regulator
MNHNGKQNITISLDKGILRKAKVLAARRDTSVSGLLTQQIEDLVGREEAYERARGEAMKLLEKGFRLGGEGMVSREELHER